MSSDTSCDEDSLNLLEKEAEDVVQIFCYFWWLLFLPMTSSYHYLTTKHNQHFNPDAATLKDYRVDIESVPYHVLVFYNSLYCSGSLIASKIVVTAATCFHKYTLGSILNVKYGSSTIINAGKTVRAKEVKKHEFFQRVSPVDNDIALVIMETHVDFDGFRKIVRKILLNEPDAPLRVGTWIQVSGWGHSNVPAQLENRLIMSEMYVTNDEECINMYNSYKTASNFCVRYGSERRLSDNGGPAVYNDILVGVSSYGANRERSPYMALVTNVSYFHRWITKNTKYFLEKYCDSQMYADVPGQDPFQSD